MAELKWTMGDQPQMAEPETECEYMCLKDDGHVERGEPHFYGYRLPSRTRLRAQLAQREGELEALRGKVLGEIRMLLRTRIRNPLNLNGDELPGLGVAELIVAALSDNQEGRDG